MSKKLKIIGLGMTFGGIAAFVISLAVLTDPLPNSHPIATGFGALGMLSSLVGILVFASGRIGDDLKK
jgi:hypothetical protein